MEHVTFTPAAMRCQAFCGQLLAPALTLHSVMPAGTAPGAVACNTKPACHVAASGQGKGAMNTAAHRALDIAVAVTAAIVLLPVLLATAIAVRLDSSGPAIFTQTRIGQGGRPFVFYKFRSMRRNAEMLRDAVRQPSDRAGICFKARNDPRVTRVGRFIRRFSIDELPQIYNVLRGEMAIVGPRPALPCEVAEYPQRAMDRFAIKPGITGIWQVSGRADLDFDSMIDMDLAYATSRSLKLDILLILMTFRAVLVGRGAH